jgi:hypothetical protein
VRTRATAMVAILASALALSACHPATPKVLPDTHAASATASPSPAAKAASDTSTQIRALQLQVRRSGKLDRAIGFKPEAPPSRSSTAADTRIRSLGDELQILKDATYDNMPDMPEPAKDVSRGIFMAYIQRVSSKAGPTRARERPAKTRAVALGPNGSAGTRPSTPKCFTSAPKPSWWWATRTALTSTP